MKFVLVINLADDVAEDYKDFTVDYDLRGTPKEDRTVNESIKYIEDAEPRPMPQKKSIELAGRLEEEGNDYGAGLIVGWNQYRNELTGETE